jgi:hypothetical protein
MWPSSGCREQENTSTIIIVLVFRAECALIFHLSSFPVLKFHLLITRILIREGKHIRMDSCDVKQQNYSE